MEKKSFLLRINEELWNELNRWAQDELRSVNGQIEYVLRDAVARRKRSGPAAQPTDVDCGPGGHGGLGGPGAEEK